MTDRLLLRAPIILGQKGLRTFRLGRSHCSRRQKNKSKHIPAHGRKPASIFQFAVSIRFNSLIFKSKKLKNSNKPLSFPIPQPWHKSRRAILIVVSDKVMVIWLCRLRAQRTGVIRGKGDRCCSREGSPGCSLYPEAITGFHLTSPVQSLPGSHASWPSSLLFPAGGRRLSF